MPVDVPKEPKKNTTVYDNFKGVDYTNDASNVFRRRSPSGKNMLPDLDGRPRKRPGWEVNIPSIAFVRLVVPDYDDTATYDVGDHVFYDDVLYRCKTTISVAEAWDDTHWDEAEMDVVTDRIHYFNYGSNDFLMIFNNLGVFYIRDDQTTVTKCQMWDESLTPPAAADFPPTKTIDVDGTPTSVVVPADANRAFFFEGNGTAGFYTFVESDLYRFGADDSGNLYFFKVTPTIPVFLIGTDPPTGVGTTNDSLNMLTDYRTIEYFGDGSTVNYKIPSAASTQTEVTVEILDSTTGKWNNIAPNDATYPWSIADNTDTLAFSGSSPAASTVGNVRITYRPTSGTSYVLTTGVDSNKVSTSATMTATYEQTETYWAKFKGFRYNGHTQWQLVDGGTPSQSGWSLKSQTYSTGSVTLTTPGIFKPESLAVKADYTGSYATQNTANYTSQFSAYNKNVSISFSPIQETIANTYGSSTESISAWTYTANGSNEYTVGTGGLYVFREEWYTKKRTKTVKKTKNFTVYGQYTKATAVDTDPAIGAQRDAFSNCQKVLGFGNNIYNQVFMSASTARNYHNRVWYCAANDPAYFPDTNYIEVGSDDRAVMGLMKVGSNLGVVKKGSGTDTSVYLAYPTSFDEETTYAVKQGVAGLGAVSTGAFNVLNEEPLFLSDQGVMGISMTEEESKQIRNRSYFVNGKLTKEANLQDAISFVFDGMYWLAVNTHCYVLDGSQKSSWANEKTNLQYECYFLDNIPAQCFAKMKGTLYFSDFKGNICRMKSRDEQYAYIDDYASYAQWVSSSAPVDNQFDITELVGSSGEFVWLVDSDEDYLHESNDDRLTVLGGLAGFNQTIRYGSEYYTVQSVTENMADVLPGVPIDAVWSTIADDDGMVHFFKNLAKKGFVISVLPGTLSGVGVYLKPDEKDAIYLGDIDVGKTELPYEIYGKKKVKKYKRLQIICRNGIYNDGFALDQIIKTYTVGNYSKNRR